MKKQNIKGVKSRKRSFSKATLKKLDTIHKEVAKLNEENKMLITMLRKEINVQQRKAS